MPDLPLSVSYSDKDRLLRAALTGLAARQRTIANNVANVDTPQFKASEVQFEDVLRDVVAGTTPESALAQEVARPRPETNTVVRADGNNVDVDREMVQLAETTLAYNTLTQATAARLSIMRSILADGRR